MPKTRYGDLVKYSNEMNQISVHGMAETDLDIFVLLCAGFKDKIEEFDIFFVGNQEIKIPREVEVVLDFSTIKKTINYTRTSDKVLISDIERMNKRLVQANTSIRCGGHTYTMPLFTLFDVSSENKTLTVQLNKNFIKFFSLLESQFTMFDLGEFVELSGKYPKLLFKNLKQYRSSGWVEWDVDSFRTLLDIPSSYKNMDVTKKCITPALKEIEPYFKNLKCEPIYDSNKRGKPLRAFRFTFEPEGKLIKLSGNRKSKKKKKEVESGNEPIPTYNTSNSSAEPITEEQIQANLKMLQEMESDSELAGQTDIFDFLGEE